MRPVLSKPSLLAQSSAGSLFVSLVDEVLFQDPDLEEAKFEILDFSAPSAKQPRTLQVIDARDVPRLPAGDKAAMLAVFAEGFHLAQAELAGVKDEAEQEAPRDSAWPDDQPGLFDPE